MGRTHCYTPSTYSEATFPAQKIPHHVKLFSAWMSTHLRATFRVTRQPSRWAFPAVKIPYALAKKHPLRASHFAPPFTAQKYPAAQVDFCGKKYPTRETHFAQHYGQKKTHCAWEVLRIMVLLQGVIDHTLTAA